MEIDLEGRTDFDLDIAILPTPASTRLARISKPEDCSVVPGNLDLDIVSLATQAFAAPNIDHVVRNIARELGNLAIICAHRPGLDRGIEQRDNRAVAGRAGPVHRWVRAVERVVGVDAPLVRPCGLADDRILVEGEQVLVLQDVDLLLREFEQIRAHEKRAFHYRPERKVRVLLLKRETVADLQICQLSPLESRNLWAGPYLEHVGIVAAPEIGPVEQEGVHIEDLEDASPRGFTTVSSCIMRQEDPTHPRQSRYHWTFATSFRWRFPTSIPGQHLRVDCQHSPYRTGDGINAPHSQRLYKMVRF